MISILPFLIYNANISGSSNVKDRKFILDTVGREEILGESGKNSISYTCKFCNSDGMIDHANFPLYSPYLGLGPGIL